MFLDDSACNLSSLNLMKFATTGVFDVESYKHAVEIMITAQEILVDHSGYPTESIARNSHDYRPLGLGYANLGALLMATGLPYDSDAGRDYAACLTAIMCGQAYLQSSRIAEQCPTLASATELTARAEHTDGACPGYFINREPFLDVIRMHRAAVSKISRANVPASLLEASQKAWDEALQHGEKFGYRNCAGHRAGSDRNHRLHDGLRHHGRRAGPGAGEVQEAGWRRHDEDRQQHGSRRRCSSSATRRSRPRRSSATSTRTGRSRARRN